MPYRITYCKLYLCKQIKVVCKYFLVVNPTTCVNLNPRIEINLYNLTDTHLKLYQLYRVFIKYCVFSQEFLKGCHLSLASTRLLLVVQKNTSQ